MAANPFRLAAANTLVPFVDIVAISRSGRRDHAEDVVDIKWPSTSFRDRDHDCGSPERAARLDEHAGYFACLEFGGYLI